MTEDGQSLRVRSTSVSWQQVDDEVVILDMDTSRYLSLNGSAGVLWRELVEGPTSVQALSRMLVDRFDVDDARADVDASAFVDQCAAFGLLE